MIKECIDDTSTFYIIFLNKIMVRTSVLSQFISFDLFFAKSVEIYAESLTEMFTIDAHTLLNERLIFAKFILLNLQKSHLIYGKIIKAV